MQAKIIIFVKKKKKKTKTFRKISDVTRNKKGDKKRTDGGLIREWHLLERHGKWRKTGKEEWNECFFLSPTYYKTGLYIGFDNFPANFYLVGHSESDKQKTIRRASNSNASASLFIPVSHVIKERRSPGSFNDFDWNASVIFAVGGEFPLRTDTKHRIWNMFHGKPR